MKYILMTSKKQEEILGNDWPIEYRKSENRALLAPSTTVDDDNTA